MPGILACGSREDAFKDSRVALKEGEASEVPLLVVDSEAPVRSNSSPWQHLRSHDNWDRPSGAEERHAHLKVQCMESWFLADVSALELFFGSGFRSVSVSRRHNIEHIPKDDVFKQLDSASRGSRKGAYRKSDHSFALLSLIDPEKVILRSPFAKRLIDTLNSHLIPS